MNITSEQGKNNFTRREDLYKRFSVIEELLKRAPQVDYNREAFPNVLRIVGKGNCWPTCILGTKMKNFCHKEGMAHLKQNQNIGDFPTTSDVIDVWETTRPNSIKIIGIECVNVESVYKLISEIRRIGCEDISTTCADIVLMEQVAPLLIKAGLTRMTLSVHRYSETEKQLLSSVTDKLKKHRIETIKINRVLLASTVNDLPDMIDWVDTNRHILRLFSIMGTPELSTSLNTEFIHWTSLIQSFGDRIKRIDVTEYVVSNRIRYKIRLKSGGIIEANMPSVHIPGKLIVAHECRSCGLKLICEEGYFGCGIRFGPDSKIYPCLLRPELSFKVERRHGDEI